MADAESIGGQGEEGEPRTVLALNELAHTKHAHEFVGAEHAGVPFSM
jgi:hypothetical protein